MDLKETSLGIEFGSTRIKAVLIDRDHKVLAAGSHRWENERKNGVWTYSYDAVIRGLRSCYRDLRKNAREKYGLELTTFGALGVSAMMHGYLPLDKQWRPLTEFRTWRNNITAEASQTLTELFGFYIPQRWCVAHLYQAIRNGEEHVKDIAHLATLACYVHYLLCGDFAAGLGEASGIVPLDLQTKDYDKRMISLFDGLTAPMGYPWRLRELLPRPVTAGAPAGTLSAEGALLLDPSGTLKPGVPMVPCEGDADTGLVATNCVREGMCSVSAGTSAFSMLVADHKLGMHRGVDMLCTPAGKPVAMVHSSNCSSDINAWVELFREFAAMLGVGIESGELYPLLFNKAVEGEKDGGGILSFNCFSGESVTGLNEGRPVLIRAPEARFDLANLMRTHLMSALTTMKIGMDELKKAEKLRVDRIFAQGGFFKTPKVGQALLSAAFGSPVCVMETAGEGGPFGMALLGAHMLWKDEGEALEDYLDSRVFANAAVTSFMAEKEDIDGFNAYAARYLKALPVEEAAIEATS